MQHHYVNAITQIYQEHGDPVKAAGAEKYLLNKFSFIGLQTPLRRQLCRIFFKEHPVDSADELEQIIRVAFASPYREVHYFAIELLRFHKQIWSVNTIPLIEWMLDTNSWWDSVDSLNSFVIGPFFLHYRDVQKAVTLRWNQSENIWWQRSSLIFQLLYKERTDTHLLTEYIERRQADKEFFIRKAIGWALRQYGRTNPDWVRNFVAHHPQLSPLSRREALKHLA